MINNLQKEIETYKDLVVVRSIRETYVKKNLPLFYDFIKEKPGKTISEKFYLLNNNVGKCKVCSLETEFLSYNRGYRLYCSKKCSNNDFELVNLKKDKYKETCLVKYGFENSSCSDLVKEKIKESKSKLDQFLIIDKIKKTCLIRYGVDNPSKFIDVKEKKKETNLKNWGVENPFQSDYIKKKSKKTIFDKFGVDHPLKSDYIKKKIKQTNLKKYDSDNYKSSEYDKIGTIIKKDINYIKYVDKSIYLMSCEKGHNYEIKYDNYYHRIKNNIKTCTICYPVESFTSFIETDIYDYIKSIYNGEIIQSYRDKKEIDIYLPELKIGFEINGVYWHSDIYKDKNYHILKYDYFKERGIRIINLWEDDWNYKKSIIKSQINNWLGIIPNKIYARKCNVCLLSESSDFLEKNHIQGKDKSNLKLGLLYNNELVSVMTFDRFEGRKKMGDNEWNLSRFCNLLDTNVIGGASKLLKYFVKNYNPKRIISYADKDWSIGNLYFKLNFNLKYETKPDYKYLVGDKRIHKSRFRKSKTGISESNLDYNKIWDCGKMKFEFIL
jgi:hypothetical protein